MAVRRAASLLGAALAFGMLAALVKGDGGGLRDTIGNVSTPWLLVAFAAGLHARSLPRGAVLGLAATVVALLGFYLVVAVTTDDQLPTLREHLAHVLRANRRWLYSGLVSGPVVGAFAAWLRRRAPDLRSAVGVVVGLLLLFEPIVIFGARIVPGWREVIHWTLSPGPYVVEAALGAALLFTVVRRARGRHGRGPGGRAQASRGGAG